MTKGAMGLMINAPIDVTVGGMLKQVEVDSERPKPNQASLKISQYLMVGRSRDHWGLFCTNLKGSYQSSINMTDQIGNNLERYSNGVRDRRWTYALSGRAWLCRMGTKGRFPNWADWKFMANRQKPIKGYLQYAISDRWKVAVHKC